MAALCPRGGRLRSGTQPCSLTADMPAQQRAQHPHVSWRCIRDSSTSGVRWRRKKALCRCARNTNRGAHARKASSQSMSRAAGRPWSPLPTLPHTCGQRKCRGGQAQRRRRSGCCPIAAGDPTAFRRGGGWRWLAAGAGGTGGEVAAVSCIPYGGWMRAEYAWLASSPRWPPGLGRPASAG